MIISNDYQTFAVFNYDDINWYSAPSRGGNPESGTGGEAARVINHYSLHF